MHNHVELMALAAIGAFHYFGKTGRGQTAQMASQVAVTGSDSGQETAASASGEAEDESDADYGLGGLNHADDDLGSRRGVASAHVDSSLYFDKWELVNG